MLHTITQHHADAEHLPAGLVHNISPYVNPTHVLAPPRSWLEAVLEQTYTWHFFRLRYKNLLRNRFRQDPERFFALLDASQGGQPLYLTCHCLAGPCHKEAAVDFLERLRGQEPYRNWLRLRPPAFTPFPGGETPFVRAAEG